MSHNQTTSSSLLMHTLERLWQAVWGPSLPSESSKSTSEPSPTAAAEESDEYKLPYSIDSYEGWPKEVDESKIAAEELNEVTKEALPHFLRDAEPHRLIPYEEIVHHRIRVASETVPDSDWPDQTSKDWWEENKGSFECNESQPTPFNHLQNVREYFDEMGIPRRIAYKVIPSHIV